VGQERGALGHRAGHGELGHAGKRGVWAGLEELGKGWAFPFFYLFSFLFYLNIALVLDSKLNMLHEFKWRHDNTKHHTKLDGPACDATTIIPLGF
jgi:hypothetical protein